MMLTFCAAGVEGCAADMESGGLRRCNVSASANFTAVDARRDPLQQVSAYDK